MKGKKEYIWSLVGRFFPLIIYLLTTMVLARYIEPEEFGKLGVLSIFFVVAYTLMDAGLGGSLIKEKEITHLDCSTIFVFNLTVSHILYLLLFLFSDTIQAYFDIEELSMIVKVLCLIFVINSWGLVPRSILTRDLRFKTLTIINVIAAIMAAMTSIVLAILKFEVYALVAYQLMNGFVGVVLSMITSRFSISFHFSVNSFKRLIPFGFFTMITTTVDTIYENLTVFLFGKYLSIHQAGLLYQAKRLEEVPSQAVAVTISNVAFPVLTKLRNDIKAFERECTNTFNTIIILLLPLLLIISLFSLPIITLVLGKQWVEAAPYLSLLIIAAIFHVTETLTRTFIKSSGQVAKLFKYTLIKRAIGIGIIFIALYFDPNYVLMGYICSTFVGYIINTILWSKIVDRSVKVQLSSFTMMLLINGCFYLAVWGLQQFVNNLFVQITWACLSLLVYYLVVMRMFKIDYNSYLKQIKSRVRI